MPKYKSKQSSRKELLKTCKEWGAQLMDTRHLLQLAEARADDATAQFNQATECLKAEIVGYSALESTCELNLLEYLKADSALRTELMLSAVHKSEIEKLKADLREWQNLSDSRSESISYLDEDNASLRRENQQIKADLAHSDAERRMLQRDILAQQEILKRFAPFHVVSPALQKGQ